MIKTDAYADKDSDLFLSELKTSFKLKDKLIEFVDLVIKDYHNYISMNQSEYNEIFSAFRCDFDISLNFYLDVNDKISISVGGRYYVSFSALSSSNDKSKCRQFHIIKLKPRSRYYECFKNLCYGRYVTDEDLDWLIKKVKSKILQQHSEINKANLDVLYALQNNNGRADLLYTTIGLDLCDKFDLLFSTRSITDNFICNLPKDIFADYIGKEFSAIDNGLPLLDIYPQALMKNIDFIDYNDGSGIDALCDKILIFSKLDGLFLIHNVMENIKSGYYEYLSKRDIAILYDNFESQVFSDYDSQDPRIEIYKSDILSYLAED